ncbi:hypothetical protein F5X68DRAFT_264252 [Plectosphaerella plurivora]|uniref:Uncharacterized protein n=1 Tax=Plectosphaerella plurivora TaxID=936078 RepID=A0A9P8V4L8_9PEZI|nr:hypothetical protein F5X68DRAFT_264252 [Plectosphaerella plurivora]
MDAAAKHIQLMRQSTLPPLPYQLAKGTDRRFRVPPDNVNVFEEREFRQLQYMTLIDVDRGLLFTRAYYDMREEPPTPSAAKEGTPQADRRPKTKLSLSDYKNKKKTYDSPPESTTAAPKPSALRKEITDGRSERDSVRKDAGTSRPRELEPHRDARTQDAHNDRSNNKPDPRSRHEPPDSSDKRKRVAEDDNLRLPKKPRPSTSTPIDDRSRTPRDDTPKRRDREPGSAQDRSSQSQGKDGRPGASSSLLNGRNVLKGVLGSQSQSNTPIQRARGDSLNGNRSASVTNNRVPLSKQDAHSKVSVPPLLSPLHFSMGDESSPPKERRRREDLEEPSRFSKTSKPSAPAPPPAKKDKSRLPPLLSPTLPPMLEEELERINHEGGGAPTTKPTQIEAKKSRPAKRDEEEDEKPKAKIKEREKDEPLGRYMVTLRCGRHNAKTLKRLLALPPKKERSASSEALGIGAARKRPAGTAELVGDSIAVKRPRMSDVPVSSSIKLGPPSTPAAKVATSMARVASNNSQAHTPGDTNSLTPGDRPPTRQEPADHARIKGLRDRHLRFRDLGNNLKHRRDALLSSGNKNGDRGPRQADLKLGIALCIESAMAYMVSFRAVFESRRLENKAQDPKTWDSILPMLDMVRHDVGEGRHPAIDALYQQLRGVILEELIKCYWSIDPVTHARSVLHYERMRASVWKSAADAADRVEEDRMRAGFGPWTSAEDAVNVGLRILRRWTADEDVAWTAEVSLQANGA